MLRSLFIRIFEWDGAILDRVEYGDAANVYGSFAKRYGPNRDTLLQWKAVILCHSQFHPSQRSMLRHVYV